MSLIQGVDERIVAFEWNNMRGVVRGNLGSPMNCQEFEVNGEAMRTNIRSMFQFRVNVPEKRSQIMYGGVRYNIDVSDINMNVSSPPQSLFPCFTLQVLGQDALGAIGFQLQIASTGTRVGVNFSTFGQHFTGRYAIYNVIGYEEMKPLLVKNQPGYTIEMNFAAPEGTYHFAAISGPRMGTRFMANTVHQPEQRVVSERGTTRYVDAPQSPFVPVRTYVEGNTLVYGTRQVKNTIDMDEDSSSSDTESSSSWGW